MRYSLSSIELAICSVGSVSLKQLRERKKTVYLNSLRGLFCLFALNSGIHPTIAGGRLARTRGNVINQAKRYSGYLDSRDKFISRLYEAINNKLNKINE
jgi:hypothetical protein